jgi:hypothetical protein
MSGDGRATAATGDGHVLRWSRSVLTEDDLHRSLNGHRRVVVRRGTVVTPLAGERLRQVSVAIEDEPEVTHSGAVWGVVAERPYPYVSSALQSLRRDGIPMAEAGAAESSERWALAAARRVADGEWIGAVFFCEDPGVVCCVANKLAGLRAVAVTTVLQAARASLRLAPNVVAVEMPGRTYFEIRQVIQMFAQPRKPECPPDLARTLRELEGPPHAAR